MNQNYKTLMLGLTLIMAGHSLYSAAARNSSAPAEDIQAFFAAAGRGDREAVLRFLDNKMDVNARDCVGGRALARAADGGHLETVKFLLDKGANVNAVAFFRSTTLMSVSCSGYLEIVKLLLAHGADSTGVEFSRPGYESIAAVFRAQRQDLNLDDLPQQLRQILGEYRGFQAGRPERLKELLGIPVSLQNMLMHMQQQQGGTSALYKPYVARVEALLRVSRGELVRVFKPESIAQLIYYFKTGKFADNSRQAESFLRPSEPELAPTAVGERMLFDDAEAPALPFVPMPTLDRPKAPLSDYVPQAALFGDMNTPD